MVKTKIIATLGPSSSSRTTLRKMMLAGLDVARLNFSHGNPQDLLRTIHLIRELNARYRRHIRILGDLEGYRIRVGKLKKPIEIRKNQTVYLTQKKIAGEFPVIPFDYSGDLKDIKPGTYIYIDDGNLTLVARSREKDFLKSRVIVGGTLKGHKGINMPGIKLKFAGLTEKDRRDIKFCVQNKLDYIAQSFVRTRADILKIKGEVRRALPQCKIIAKIENRDGIKNIGEIIDASDGIMIARGDMGVCIPVYEVPIVQKNIIKRCNNAGKFVITATQMLESMTENLRPTRAEVSDVANAIIDGSNYVMLSAETSVGAYPVEAVKMMNQIIKFTEGYLSSRRVKKK
jgi:pyruvate kinase